MNGTVKVVLVCGFSLVFGFYAFMIQGFNNRIMETGDQKNYYTQAQMVAAAGLNHAIYKMRDPGLWGYSGTVLVNNLVRAGGDTASYFVERNVPGLSSDEARVTVTADFNGVAAKQIAVIKPISTTGSYYQMKIVKVYIYPYQLPVPS